jgi:hypothetical protein
VNDIEAARLLALRMALKLEVRGMKRHGRSARVIANEAMGTDHRTARKAYVAFNQFIVARLGPDFDKPLDF